MQVLIADTGPIIALAKINRLGLLHSLFQKVLLTPMVLEEIQRGKDETVQVVQTGIQQKWIELVACQHTEHFLDILDLGEASALSLCLEKENYPCLIDEQIGRRIACQNGIRVIGTVGVLLLAKQHGLLQRLLPILQELRNKGYWLSDHLISEAARLASE